MEIVDDRETQEAGKPKRKKVLRQVTLLVGAGVLFCFIGSVGAYFYNNDAALLLVLLGAFLLWPLTTLAFSCMLFMVEGLWGVSGIVLWTFCIWRLWKAKKWSLYFGIGTFLMLALFVAGNFLLRSTSASQPPADASNIVLELRSMKAVALMYKTERNDDLSDLSESENHVAVFAPYVDNPSKYTNPNTVCSFRVINGVGWVGYSLDRAKKTRDTYEKLAGRAATTGLLKSPTIDVPPASDDVTHRYTEDANAVWIRAF